ncbi:DUF1064 domain-containing protein [Stenotrophomonas sp. NPDC078853]|uniref:DUF1064 domain-containing protein n=1 Tax=Stenotrophomonas sp. NPDC078853 TaxID=3364534 RepID=UPI00384CC659
MNKTEAEYEQHLKTLLHAGAITWYCFEGYKFRLADNTFYSPDFAVMLPGGMLEMHEVKGYWLDDARAKIKVAASLFPHPFVAVMRRKKKDGGGWAEERF